MKLRAGKDLLLKDKKKLKPQLFAQVHKQLI